MNRILRGAVLLAVTAALGACSTEPDQFKDGTPTKIMASPSTVLVAQADSQAVIIRTVDEQGTSVISPITVTTVGDGITVVPDSAFKPIYNSGDSLVYNPNATELRFFVKASEDANQLLPWSFDVSSGDLTLTVPVTIYPKAEQDIAISNVTPVLAEVITVTPNAGIHFTDSTKVSFGTASPRIISLAPDQITMVVGPNQSGPATFTNVGVSYNPNLAFSVNSILNVTGVKVDTFFVTVSTNTPASNQPVTVTLTGNPQPELFNWEFGTTTFLTGSDDAAVLNVSADGKTANILPTPGSDDQLFANAGLIDDFAQTLPTNQHLTVGPLTAIAGTGAFATAPTLTAPGVDSSIAFWNSAPFGLTPTGFGGRGQLFKLTVPNDGDFTITLDNVSDGADLGVYFYTAAEDPMDGDEDPFVDAAGNGAGANGESGDVTLAAGTYYMGVIFFSHTGNTTQPAKYRLIMTGLEPE
ncbi:MAG TPA: hypothetical protein VFK36_00910 [Gemmatimonadales bacterium]|nr:hypothetical protein [Gemmatimonadales bacterium]